MLMPTRTLQKVEFLFVKEVKQLELRIEKYLQHQREGLICPPLPGLYVFAMDFLSEAIGTNNPNIDLINETLDYVINKNDGIN